MASSAADMFDVLIRRESTRILATLIRLTADITLAEDALQGAMVMAGDSHSSSAQRVVAVGPPDRGSLR